ncbi:MAG: tetratricopeptide repeat protein [Planctomycetes bacterium]|nr:tetratricopeptide repeat protein [Planctomycetota bacterium]
MISQLPSPCLYWHGFTGSGNIVAHKERVSAMDVLSRIWQWLLDENNRGAAALVGTGVAATAAAGWALFRYSRKRPDVPKNTDSSNRTTHFGDAGTAQYVERMDGGTLSINSGPNAEQIRAISEPLLGVYKDQKERIAQLSLELEISKKAVQTFLGILGEKQVPRERWPEKLAQIARDHLSLLKRLDSLPADDAVIEEKTRAARDAVEAVDHKRAEALLEQLDLETAEREGTDAKTPLRRAAETRAARGELAMTRIDYRAAAEHFRRATELADGIDAELAKRFLHERADALYKQGEERGDNEALTEAIDAWRNLLERLPRERVPLDWAMTQNNLGNALTSLGERESGTAKLEEAVAAYREALKEYTRERVPLDWATTQNNLGNALMRLGERESGTAKLEEAVSAFREALNERTRERVPLDWATTQNNLGNALMRLGERESGTAKLEEAVSAYREALGVYESAEADHFITVVRENLQRAERLLDERRDDDRQDSRPDDVGE